MKKIIDFLSAPAVNMFVGLILILYLGYCISQYDSFDPVSAFAGGFGFLFMNIFDYGFNCLVDRWKSKKTNDRGSEGEN